MEYSFEFPSKFSCKMPLSTSLKNLQLCKYYEEEFFSEETLIKHMRCHYNNPMEEEYHGVSDGKEDVSNNWSDSVSNPSADGMDDRTYFDGRPDASDDHHSTKRGWVVRLP